MTRDTILIAIAATLAVGLTALGGLYLRDRRHRSRTLSTSAGRILFPFAGHTLSQRALDAALRIALAERATVVPVFLARVPMQLPLDSPLPRQCEAGLPLLETIEQRATALGVPVDARVERGRTLRHGLREAIDHERFDRIFVAAASRRSEGLRGDDVAWLLDHAPGEVTIIRPGGDDRLLHGARRSPEQPRRRPQAPATAEPVPLG